MISLPSIEDAQLVCAGPAATAAAEMNRRFREIADFCGWQEDGMGGGFPLWNLKINIPGHPAGSTVVEATLEKFLSSAMPATLVQK